MNKYIKVLSVVLALSSSVYLPHSNAATSTDMLINIAETDPVMVERLNDIALNDPKLLRQLVKMADSDTVQLEKLLNIAETDPAIFTMLVNIKSAEMTGELKIEADFSTYGQATTFGIINDSGGIIQN